MCCCGAHATKDSGFRKRCTACKAGQPGSAARPLCLHPPVLRPTKKATGEPSRAAAGSLTISCTMGRLEARRPAAEPASTDATWASNASTTRPSTFSTTPAWVEEQQGGWRVKAVIPSNGRAYIQGEAPSTTCTSHIRRHPCL